MKCFIATRRNPVGAFRRFVATAPSRIAAIDTGTIQRNPHVPRSRESGYVPLDTSHPVFGLKRADISPAVVTKPLLSTNHPVFGTRKAFSTADNFSGHVGISGFFLAVDPNFCFGPHDRMNPNAQLTVRDNAGNLARIRYRCDVEADLGFKVEALIRVEVGWISPKVVYSAIPHVIHLGKGIDLSVPFVLHFTMISILDEHGNSTGSFLYFSGTPWAGFSAGFSRIRRGKLVLSPEKEIDIYEEEGKFIGHIHYRQVFFVLFKFLMYVVCIAACIPATRRLVQYLLPPDPFYSSQ
ncbi:hypothetical protein AGDE_01692 [Angomonas deanei]|nr:hypothetical protein AGDE_01692 [Angomonas deanei]|eukprot:EPY42231.1 hypothetical protein AGDE_01692 [Angomonas deanei]